MFDDIVANTNPNLYEHEENMYINPLNIKKRLQTAKCIKAASEACISDIDKIDKDFDMLSDFSEDIEREAMFDFLRLRQANDLETAGVKSNIFQHQARLNKYSCRSEIDFEDNESD